ncbi:MAG: hypothetical protein P8X98_12680, partial [Woeseiaceae bacterium]
VSSCFSDTCFDIFWNIELTRDGTDCVMKQQTGNLILRNPIFAWIVLATLAILLVPLIAMQFTTEVRWDRTDFIVMGVLLSGMATLFVLAARKISPQQRTVVGVLFGAVFLYVWAELAVGVFSNLGS